MDHFKNLYWICYSIISVLYFCVLATRCVEISALWPGIELTPPAFSSVQFSSIAQPCPTLCDHMNCSTPGLPVHHQLLESTLTHVRWVSDVIQPSHPLSSPSPPAPNPSQHQGLFQWVNSLHEVTKVLEFQLQHQSFQWTPRTDLLEGEILNTGLLGKSFLNFYKVDLSTVDWN